MTAILDISAVNHSYEGARRRVRVLKGVSMSLEAGTFYTILGPSGSGKTTLLSLASGLDTPTGGTISYRGEPLGDIGLAKYRRDSVATIFQSYNLLPYLSALQNVLAAMEITGVARSGRKRRAMDWLERLGLDGAQARSDVRRLSGGQQQRVAIARALACDVDILFADEPTGNLDADTADGIVDIFGELAHDRGKCVVVVTHSLDVARRSDRRFTLQKGKITARN